MNFYRFLMNFIFWRSGADFRCNNDNDNDNDTLREVQHLSDEGLALQARV